MNSSLIKLIALILVLAGVIYVFFIPFTKHQITSQVHTYFDYIQETKKESLSLITTREQFNKDKQVMNNIALEHNGQFEFTNRSMKIVENSQSHAVVKVSVVVKASVDGKIQTQSQNFIITLTKALNNQGDKTWIITERAIP